MAEQIVAEYIEKFPICIVRPSIITNSLKEPAAGWVDNYNGITGLMVQMYVGAISTLRCNSKQLMDIVPVDIVSNVLLTAAWYNQYKS